MTTGSSRSSRTPSMPRTDSGRSSPSSPSVWRISSVRKNALPPVAARSSAASIAVAPVQLEQLADLAPCRARRPRRASAGRRGRARRRPGRARASDRRQATRTVATTIVRDVSSWRRTCSIILSDGASAHCTSSSTISIGCIARLAVQQFGDRLEQQVALDARVGPLEPHPRDEMVQLGQQQREHARGRRPRARPASADTVRSAVRNASTIGSNGTIASGVARPHSTMPPCAWTSAAKRAAEPGLAGAGLAASRARWRSPPRRPPTRAGAACRAGRARPTNAVAPARTAGPGQRHR